MRKRHLAITGLAAAAVFFLSMATIGFAQSSYSDQMGKDKKEAMPKAQMSEYLVISPHTAAECDAALMDVEKIGKDVLAKYDWGCMSGDHTGYLRIQAASEADALKMVPENIRGKARAIKIVKFTPEQIASFHKNQ